MTVLEIAQARVVGEQKLRYRTIRIGVISATTAGLDTLVPLYTDIIEPDINDYCAKLPRPRFGRKLNIKFLFKDSDGQAAIHVQRVQEFHEMGVDLIIGGRWSSQAEASLDYVNEFNMLLFSPSSTSPLLAIPDDNLFRLCPDDTKQAPAIAEMLWSWGIEAVIVIQRGDAWADGIYNTLQTEYPARGGVILERIRYPAEVTEFTSYLETAEAVAADAVGIYGSEHVGVLIISFYEAVTMVAQAVDFPTIYSLYWFGSEGTAHDPQPFLDDVPVEADHLKIFSTQSAPEYSSKFNEMSDRYYDLVSQPLDFYTTCDIDIAWIIAQAVLETRGTDATDVINVIPDIASRYFGYTGWCLLNKAGDRYTSNFDIWGYGYVDSVPSHIKYGYYDSTTGQVIWDVDALGFTPSGHD